MKMFSLLFANAFNFTLLYNLRFSSKSVNTTSITCSLKFTWATVNPTCFKVPSQYIFYYSITYDLETIINLATFSYLDQLLLLRYDKMLMLYPHRLYYSTDEKTEDNHPTKHLLHIQVLCT